jgi:chloramphenicol 3-O-phosphotransferase
MEADKLRFKSRSFESLVGHGICVRMATQIYNHTEWLPEDCGRWLEHLGVWPNDVQWILEQVSRRRCRAAWAKVGGLKPGTRL